MYCVKCGVKLQEGTEKCPLCGTPVWNPDGLSAESTYSSRMPDKAYDRDPLAAFLTVLTVLASVAVSTICLVLYGKLGWGAIVLASLLLFFVIAVLPVWFRDPNPVIFLPIDTLALELFLLFICRRTGGHWFMSFAFPCVGIMGIIGTATAALLKYLKKGGRITPAAAAVGTILKIKPVLQIQGEKLDAYAKAKGYRRAKEIMLSAVERDIKERFRMDDRRCDMWIAVAYSGNEEEGAKWKEEVQAAYPDNEIIMNPLSLSVACHIGPGALAITCTKKLDVLK